MLWQFVVCTTIPFPFVIYPIISSPFTGLQQLARFTFISSTPDTIISFLGFVLTFTLVILLRIISSFDFASLVTTLTTDKALYLPFPTLK